jgi:hypothetical protein
MQIVVDLERRGHAVELHALGNILVSKGTVTRTVFASKCGL